MIRSMTGYGRSECINYNRKIGVEIKAVNHRYNELSIKLPRIMNAYEENIRKFLSGYINRGKTDVYIYIESFSKDDIQISLNEALSDAYTDTLLQLRERYKGKDIMDDISLSLLARFPDVISVEKSVGSKKAEEEIKETLLQALKEAAEKFVKMREKEGEALRSDVLKKSEAIQELLVKIKKRAPRIAEEYHERLTAKMKEVLAGYALDESRILTEAAIFADKICIDEELTRLASHIRQLRQIISIGGAIGKKLDFLVQEIVREVNTIGSKSNDLEITTIIVNIKSEVEKVREQVQNIE